MSRALIVGIGRSGTGYIARVLQLCGMEIAHEGVYGPLQALGREGLKWWDLDGDSSWLAVPLIASHDGPVFLQVRDPLACIPSLAATGLFADVVTGIYQDVVRTHAPEVFWYDSEIERAAAFWVAWNQRALPWVRGWWRVEDVGVEEIRRVAESLGRFITEDRATEALAEVPRDFNTRTGTDRIGLDDIADDALRYRLKWSAATFGYALDRVSHA